MLVFNQGEIITGTGEKIKNGILAVEEGKIIFVGEKFDPPSDSEIIDLKGKIVSPGFIDAHTHVGIGEYALGWEGQDYNEYSDPVTPHLRAIDGINPRDKSFENARKNGVTTVMIAPGSFNVLGGETAVLKTRGRTVDEMVISTSSGIKSAFGENPKRVYGQKPAPTTPVTRMGTAALLRQALSEGLKYAKEYEESGELPHDLKKKSLLQIVKGERKLRVHAHRADDIMTSIRIAKEFGIKVVIEHCTEGHLIAKEIKESGFPIAVGPALAVPTKIELKNLSWETPAALQKEGVLIALISDHPVTPVEHLRLAAAMAVKVGLPKDEAMKAITINAASILDQNHRLGSLEEGKDADFLIWDGDPFKLESELEGVFIEGVRVG